MASDMIQVRPAGEMGQGLFAVVDIPQGTRIIAESPFILLDQSSVPFAMFCGIVQDLGDDVAKLDRLTFNERLLDDDEPHNLLDQIRQEGAEVDEDDLEDPDVYAMVERYAKFYTNSAEIKSNGKYMGAGLFLHFSRMNHSCLPNAFSNWNPAIGQQTVQAARDIKAGEQIFFSYLGREGTFKSRQDRASMIEKFWGFECGCHDCVHAEASDVLRGRMGSLDQDMSRLSELCQAAYGTDEQVEPLAKEALVKAKTLMALMDEAGLGGWKLVERYVVPPTGRINCPWTNHGCLFAVQFSRRNHVQLHPRGLPAGGELRQEEPRHAKAGPRPGRRGQGVGGGTGLEPAARICGQHVAAGERGLRQGGKARQGKAV